MSRSDSRKKSLQLSVKWAASIFFILLLSQCILIGLTGLLAWSGILSMPGHGWIQIVLWCIAILLMTALLTGLLVSLVIKPLEEVIDAQKRIAAGEYSVRLHLKKPKELLQISDAFNQMAAQLENSRKLRNSFINDFSHELRTPIASIHGFAKLLNEKEFEPGRQKEYLQIIEEESARLTELSSSILTLYQIESTSGIPDDTNFDLAEQIRLCVLTLEPYWQKKELQIDLDIPEHAELTACEPILRQVWMHLVDNAIKFSRPQGRIHISLQQDETHLIVEIKDEGIGMQPDQLEHAFDTFYQADASRFTPGSGLGLTLVKRVLDLHHGTIQLESSPETGTTCTVCLPLKV